MRWLVEVNSLGKTETESLYIDADSWQKALQAARGQRGESSPMSGFSIELLDDGCRAVDPMSRLRYEVRRAPDHRTTTSQPPPLVSQPPHPLVSQPPPPPSQPPRPPPSPHGASEPPRPSQRPSLSAAALSAVMGQSAPTGARSAETGKPSAQRVSAGPAATHAPAASAARAEVAAKVPSQVIFKREHDATDSVPLTYREYVFLVPAGTSEAAAETLLQAQFQLVLASLVRAPAGKFVNLGVFDVAYEGKPTVAPLATLMWKDWRGAPFIDFPRRLRYTPKASAPPVAPVGQPPKLAPAAGPLAVTPAAAPSRTSPGVAAQVSAVAQVAPPMAAPATPVAPAPSPAIAAAPSPAVAPAPSPAIAAAPSPAVAPAPSPVIAAAPSPAIVPAPPPPLALQPPAPPAPQPRIRARGEDLISELFESMHDLHFLRDAVEGGDFCLNLAMERIPSQAGLVHLYDIDRREFLVTSTRGVAAGTLLLRRHPEGDATLSAAMSKRRAIVFTGGSQSELASVDRYVALGGIQSLVIAPVILEGRFLGAIELLNTLDGQPFTEGEGNALTYIAEQFAEFVASRGVVTDPERIRSRVG
jgi:GAF domain-containing protein